MNVAEICPLTPETVTELLATREGAAPRSDANGRRKVHRWPFPGTAELWIPEDDGTERYLLATVLNISHQGVGIRCEEPLSLGTELAIAIHEPAASLHGRVVVRHCTGIEIDYLVGLQFVFDAT